MRPLDEQQATHLVTQARLRCAPPCLRHSDAACRGNPEPQRLLPAKTARRGARAGSNTDARARPPGETPGPCAAAALGVAVCYDMPKHTAAPKAAA